MPCRLPSSLRLALAASAVVLAACAPDAARNIQAKDFNAYLDSLKTACPNMVMGSSNISDWRRTGDGGNSNYVYWLDQTSRHFYQHILVKQYRNSISAALGGRSDAPALGCIVRNLPADRPTHLAGGRL